MGIVDSIEMPRRTLSPAEKAAAAEADALKKVKGDLDAAEADTETKAKEAEARVEEGHAAVKRAEKAFAAETKAYDEVVNAARSENRKLVELQEAKPVDPVALSAQLVVVKQALAKTVEAKEVMTAAEKAQADAFATVKANEAEAERSAEAHAVYLKNLASTNLAAQKLTVAKTHEQHAMQANQKWEAAVQHVTVIQQKMTELFHVTPEGQAKFDSLESQVAALKPDAGAGAGTEVISKEGVGEVEEGNSSKVVAKTEGAPSLSEDSLLSKSTLAAPPTGSGLAQEVYSAAPGEARVEAPEESASEESVREDAPDIPVGQGGVQPADVVMKEMAQARNGIIEDPMMPPGSGALPYAMPQRRRLRRR